MRRISSQHVCLYFGSFNPLHLGHLSLTRYARENLHFDEVRLVLSPLNPQKDIRQQLPTALRRLIIEASLDDEPNIHLEPLELYLPLPHYTIRSIQALRLLEPHTEFCILIGADNLGKIQSWYQWSQLLELVELWVYPRPGYPMTIPELSPELARRIHLCPEAPTNTLSSTLIRQKAQLGESLVGLIPQAERWEGQIKEALEALTPPPLS